MTENFIILYRQIRAHFDEMYRFVKEIEAKCKTSNSLEYLTDAVYAFRESYRYADDTRKELKKLQELCERLACLLWTTSECTEPIRTNYAIGIPTIKMMASIPKRNTQPEAYAILMRHLKVPEELWAGDEEVMRPYWPGFVEYLSRLAEIGEALPEGIDPTKTYPVYSLQVRRVKNIDEETYHGPIDLSDGYHALGVERPTEWYAVIGPRSRELGWLIISGSRMGEKMARKLFDISKTYADDLEVPAPQTMKPLPVT